jgi:protein gp37
MRWIRTDRLRTDADIAGLFPIRVDDLRAVEASMRGRGYDAAEPLVVWESTVVDGHTRLRAAVAAGVERVYVDERSFADKRDALEYAIARQRDRRNLTRPEMTAFIVRAIDALDRLKPAGQRTDLASVEARSGKSAAETAETLGVSRAQVERVRAVQSSENEAVKQQLREGSVTIRGAYDAIKQETSAKQDSAEPEPLLLSVQLVPSPGIIKASYSVGDWQTLSEEQRDAVLRQAPLRERATFNWVNEHIEWAGWSWNPVTGCLHNCAYCYARDIAERFYGQKFAPTFLPSRLYAPRHTVPKPLPPEPTAEDRIRHKSVFVCSMADLFGNWVPKEWVGAVFDQIVASPQWNFLCLTKFPQRLAEIQWPENAWCGTSVDYQYRVEIAERSFRNVRAGVKWLSCEPLMERLTFKSLEMFDWVVIGAASQSTQTPEFQPPWEWVEHLIGQARAAGCSVYVKPNLKSRPREYPASIMPRPSVVPNGRIRGKRAG